LRRCSSGASTAEVIVFRPLFAVGGQDLGYLPGSEMEKMSSNTQLNQHRQTVTYCWMELFSQRDP
jgi:predicted ribonuclease YlaK